MSDQPLSVKYRPRKLADVMGQDVAVQTLTNAFKSKTLHHAYIFAGKFGSGKTSCARILAAMENCSEGPTLEPCGSCDNCKAIFEGKSLDVKELDAASNRSINDIRALKNESRYNPVNCRVKYFIIDESHSLTPDAVEAMLKMIEEPPPHVRFVLCTTDPHLLKDTIHSRCIVIKFNRIGWTVLHEQVRKVAAAEGLTIDDEALKIAARASSGSARNALQNLQTLVNYAGDRPITLEDARKVLNGGDSSLYFHLIDAVTTVKTPKAMQVVNHLLRDGRQANEVVDGLFEHLRNLMVTQTCGDDLASFGFSEDEAKRLRYQSEQAKLGLILAMMKLVGDVSRGLSLNLDPQILLEKFVIESIIEKKKAERQVAQAVKK